MTLKGFKSFPDRTRLEFGPGVSVIVGPNGSGKSNVTDAVLWAMGEQSPLAVRGQSMQDVIFGGGRGVQARSSAEVEIVLDNADGTVDLPVGEISILRRLDRSGEGEYRLNGARCRLVDVLEVLSDTGLGKEMHSVVSQGRVEAIVTSKPKDRRLLIEEAAGLGKHRKRRRRAQLKLERTQDNLDRALDVEREARSRLRPLKRQAEAAELHERLERQTVEARWELARDDRARARAPSWPRPSRRPPPPRAEREEAQGRAARGRRAPRSWPRRRWPQRSEQREALARARRARARRAADRIELRLERTRETAEQVAERARVARAPAGRAAAAGRRGPARRERAASGSSRSRPQLERARRRPRARALERELQALGRAARRGGRARRGAEGRRSRASARRWPRPTRPARRPARRAARPRPRPRRRAARPPRSAPSWRGANQFLRSHSGPGGRRARRWRTSSRSSPAPSWRCRPRSARALTRRGRRGPRGGRRAARPRRARRRRARWSPPARAAAPHRAPHAAGPRRAAVRRPGPRSRAGARRSRGGCSPTRGSSTSLDDVPDAFTGVAVTAAGRAWLGATRELRQAAEGGAERVLASATGATR